MCLTDSCGPITRRTMIAASAATLATPDSVVLATPHDVHQGSLVYSRGGSAIDAHLAVPLRGAVQGIVVVLHGNAGLPVDVTDTAAWLAGQGFAGLAVSSTSREPDVSMIAPAFLAGPAYGERHFEDARAGVAELRHRAGYAQLPVAVFGYCGGGYVALQWNARHPGEICALVGAHVAFRNAPRPDGRPASRPEGIDLYRRFTAPTQLHFGDADSYTPPRDIAELRAIASASQSQLQVFIYEGAEHGFPMSTMSTYRAEYAELLRRRAAPFLRRQMSQGEMAALPSTALATP